jgi:hypothetical protein
MVICRVCRTLGVCLWCSLTLPQGVCITVCPKHVGAVNWQAKRHRRTVEARRTTHYEQEGHYDPR